MLKNKFLWLGIGLLVLVCTYLFFALFESYTRRVDQGWSDRAIRTPFLAAQLFLDRQGMEVYTVNSLSEELTLAERDTLVVEDSHHILSGQQATELIDWMHRGGHLIVAAHRGLEGTSDPLMAAFDISVEKTECGCDKYEEASVPDLLGEEGDDSSNDNHEEVEHTRRPISDWLRRLNEGEDIDFLESLQDDTERKVDPGKLTGLRFGDIDGTVSVLFHPRWVLKHPYLTLEEGEAYAGPEPFYWESSEQGVHFMQFEVGEGLLSVMSDVSPWTNDDIDQFDHAWLLTILTMYSDSVYFLAGHVMPSIYALAWRYGKEIVVAGGICLLLWLIYRGRRFLPPEALVTVSRRSLAEHLRAVAWFFWHRKSADELLISLQEEVRQRAAMVIHGYASFSEAERIRVLSELSGMSAQTVATALASGANNNEVQFTQSIQFLQKIRTLL